MKDYKKEYIEKLKNELNGEFELLGEYNGSNENALHRHTICGYEWEITPNRIIQRHSCPKCSGKLKRLLNLLKKKSKI